MSWFPPHLAGFWGGPVETDDDAPPDPAWGIWQDLMKQYQNTTSSEGLPKLSFWLVIGLPAKDYSDKIEWHEEVPMLMPVSGTGKLVGLAQSKAELDRILVADKNNVHLTYKVKIQGQKAWRDLVEFLAEHDMIEKE